MQVPNQTVVFEQPGEYGVLKMSQLASLIEAYGKEHPEILENTAPSEEAKSA